MRTASGASEKHGNEHEGHAYGQFPPLIPIPTVRSAVRPAETNVAAGEAELPTACANYLHSPLHGSGIRSGHAVVGFAPSMRRVIDASSPELVPVRGEKRSSDRETAIGTDVIGYQIDVAFEFARQYPYMGEPITAASVSKAISGVYPVLVALHGSRDRSTATRRINAATLLVEPSPIAQLDLLGNVDLRVMVNRGGETVLDVTSMLVHPTMAVLWTAEQLRAKAQRLNEGSIVTSGSFPLILDVRPGDQLVANVSDRSSMVHRF